MDFYYYGGYIWNYDLRLEYFLFEGMYVFTEAMLYANNGSAYGGQGGLYASFVRKSGKQGAQQCIAIMDSGMALEAMGVTFSGFALLGFEDSNHRESMGLLDLVESMVIGTSAMAQYDIDGAVGMYAGIFNNPFMIWGKYRKGFFKTTLTVSFQFHHTQMDGAHAARFLDGIQNEINNLKI